MRREIAVWKVLAALMALLAVSSGGAVALAAADQPAAQVTPEPQGALTPNRSTTFVPLTPCRVFSTTPPSIPGFGVEQTRQVKVVGNLSSQGGQAAGCGIPNAATAIEASISATNNQGAGYVRAWPATQSEPLATILNYTPAGASTNTGALTITPGGANAFQIKNYGSVTDVVVDVQGYYVRPMYALVNPNGSIQASSRLDDIDKVGTGQYQLDFQVDTDTCVRTVSVGRSRTSDPGSSGFASAHITETPANEVFVTTYDPGGAIADRAFMVEITC